ncbi:MAG: hypothetical protein LUD00_04945 [Prevotellaceae bacterium]|nr:hypothetical protein [Prevotellaceae bacterium]
MKKIVLYSLVILLFSCSDDVSIDNSISQGLEHEINVFISKQEKNTRAIVSDEETSLVWNFKQNDKAIAFGVDNGYDKASLLFNETSGSFRGYKISSARNEIALLFPEQQTYAVQNGRVLLSLPSQNGTLFSLANTSYQWGYASLFEAENGYVGYTTMTDLMAICRFSFLVGDAAIRDIVDVHLTATKGAFYIDRHLNISSGSFEDGNLVSEMTVHNFNGIDSTVYMAFFPSSFELDFEITDASGNMYEGNLRQNKYVAGQYNTYTVQCSKSETQSVKHESDYIEVCGIQWAKGNLVYDATSFGDNGMMEHYYLADTQWYYPELDNSDDYHISHFNWGVLSNNALSHNLYANYKGDLGSKMFAERSCVNQVNSFSFAQYGDIAYWSTKGKMRMPSQEEMYKLYSEASYSRGYYVTPSGEKINGYLFWTPQGEREINLNVNVFTDSELDTKLFLPEAGLRETKMSSLNFINNRGYYWHSNKDENMNQLMLCQSGLIWRSTGAGYGRSVRPVKNSESIPPDEDKKDYIEFLGTKWAKGNLQYGASLGTSDGFRDLWSIANDQWRYPESGLGFGNHSSTLDFDAVYHFNWGVCGENAVSQSLYAKYNGDIAGKMFVNQNCTQQTTDFNQASFGDIAYWASNGKYRMPTEEEMKKLFTEASYSHGCYVAADGSQTFGFLFKEPENGKRVVETKFQNYTDYDLEHFLFLPNAGNRQSKSDVILRIGYTGYYWHSCKEPLFEQMKLGTVNLDWTSTNPAYGRTIRPVLNE